MNSLIRVLLTITLIGGSLGTNAAGLLIPKGSVDSLTIKEHHVEVVVEDGYAVTSVTQIFHNDASHDSEAIYSFPVPKDGAVGEFSVWIDGKPVVGEVVEKKKAREIYEQEKSNGNEVGLTEQKGYQTFETSVYPVRANSDTKIQIRYFQSAEIDMDVGRWVYPLEDGGVDEEALAFWDTNTKVTKAFSFNMKIRSGYPIDAIRVPNHAQANIQKLNDNEWQISIVKNGNTSPPVNKNEDKDSLSMAKNYVVGKIKEATIEQIETLADEALSPVGLTLNDITKHKSNSRSYDAEERQGPVSSTQSSTANLEAFKLDKDLVVYWKLKQGLPGSIDLVTYRPDPTKKGTFMLVFTPGDELSEVNRGKDWVFVLDISGSMQGKFASLVEGVRRSLTRMRPNDRFRIILFNDGARELTNGYINATSEGVQHYLSKLDQVRPDNGTNLYAGLAEGLNSLDADRPTGIILVTDGVANVGETRKESFFKLLDKRDVRLFTFVMGNSANTPLLEPLARRSGGFSLSVSNADDIIGRVMLASQRLTHNAFHDIDVDIEGVKVTDMSPEAIGSLYRGQQLILMGHYWQHGQAKVELNAKLSGQPKSFSTLIEFPETSTLNPELERLWAYAKIKDLSQRMQDFTNEDHKNAITDTALEYGLVTEYTSMIVLREEQFQAHNIERKNKLRTEKEAAARSQRANQPVRSNRADEQKPAFQRSRPSFGKGGGSFGWGFALFTLLLIFTRNHRR